jgi:hypothetical protein
MIIGEIVERLIYMRDHTDISFENDNAICEACNLLDELPRMEEYEVVREKLRSVSFDNKE